MQTVCTRKVLASKTCTRVLSSFSVPRCPCFWAKSPPGAGNPQPNPTKPYEGAGKSWHAKHSLFPGVPCPLEPSNMGWSPPNDSQRGRANIWGRIHRSSPAPRGRLHHRRASNEAEALPSGINESAARDLSAKWEISSLPSLNPSELSSQSRLCPRGAPCRLIANLWV